MVSKDHKPDLVGCEVVWMEHEYLGGYKESSWTIVDSSGKPVRNEKGITLRFSDKVKAEKYLAH